MLQILGTVFGLLYVWLMIKQNVWCWPVSVAYIVVSYLVFFDAHLYAEFVSHTAYLILTIYGWYYWLKKKTPNKISLVISTLNIKQITFLLMLNLIMSIIFGWLLMQYTNNAYPYLDALLAVLSCTGMWLSSTKKIENWHLWIVVNVVSIGLYLRQNLHTYAVLYSVFLVLAIVGYREWKKALQHA